METTPQEITQLFVKIVAPASVLPYLRLSPDEVQHFQKYSLPVILRSFKSTSRWLEKRKAAGINVGRKATLRSIKEACDYSGSRMKPAPMVHAGPTSEDLDILELREQFQDTIGNDEWTLTAEETQGLLSTHDASTLKVAFTTLQTWVRMQDLLPSQQAIVDQLYFSLADFTPSNSVLAVR